MRGPNAPNAGGGDKIRGPLNPRWAGGVGRSAGRSKGDPSVAAWRRAVFARDKYACRLCDIRPTESGKLCAHHRVPWSVAPELRFEVDNGVTLCVDCHRIIHETAGSSGVAPDLGFLCPANVRVAAIPEETAPSC